MTKQEQVQVGQRWQVRIHGFFTVVRITEIFTKQGYRRPGGLAKSPDLWRAKAINEISGREVTIKSPAKLRRLVA